MRLELFTSAPPSGTPLATSDAHRTLGLGENLHLALVELQLADAASDLNPGTIYRYDLLYEPDGGEPPRRLSDLGLLSGTFPLGYSAGALPSFSLPPGLDELHIVYGSCRKAHGPSQDALPLVDRLIARSVGSADARPHQLLLGGDQIYADDVAPALLRTLTATAADLLAGWSHLEQIPLSIGQGTVDWTHRQLAPGPDRLDFLKLHSTLTSGHKDSHLLFLGEYYAMYLLAWSPALWPREGQRVSLPDHAQAPRTRRKEFDESRTAALDFARTLRPVRRVLANVPTYMIFDDHEVTDDWLLDGFWDYRARENPVSRRVMRNGLLAYAAFQDWGNQPERYRAGLGRFLFDNIKYAGSSPAILDSPSSCDLALDIGQPHLPRPTPAQRIHWDFTVPGPEHVVLALDSRTWREFGAQTTRGGAGLISETSMQRQIDQRRNAIGNRLPIIIAPSPVLGHPIVEVAQEAYGGGEAPRADESKAAAVDLEAWGSNRKTFESFLRRIARFGRAVILSGDVHYAFSNHLAYFPDGEPAPAPSRIVQLCASAFKNESAGTSVIGTLGYLGLRSLGWLGFREGIDQALSDDLKAALVSGIEKDSLDRFLTELYFGLMVHHRLEAPAVIPSGPWITHEAFEKVKALVEGPFGNRSLTQWRYRITYLRDTRTPTTREEDAPGLKIVVQGDRSHLTRTVVLDNARTIVGRNNCGALKFQLAQDGTPASVRHRLYWHMRGEPASPAADVLMYSEATAPLTRPPPDERPTVFQLIPVPD